MAARRAQSAKMRVGEIRLIDHGGVGLGPKAESFSDGGASMLTNVEDFPVDYKRLAKKLLSLTPSRMAPDIALFTENARDVKKLLSRGELFPFGIEVKSGRGHRCHSNTALWYAADPQSFSIATGYAGGSDADEKNFGWRQHSWLLLKSPPAPGRLQDHVVETTARFSEYFGVKLDEKEAEQFVLNEFDDDMIDKIVYELRPKIARIASKAKSPEEASTKVQRLLSTFSNKYL